MSCPGRLMIKPLEAKITRNTEWFGQMNPFVQFDFENQRYATQVCRGGGTQPVWNEMLTFNRLDGHLLYISLLNYETVKGHDAIGSVEIDVSEVFTRAEPTSRWVDMYYDGMVSATIRLEMFFQPLINPNNFFPGIIPGESAMLSKNKQKYPQNYQQPQNQPQPYYPQQYSQTQPQYEQPQWQPPQPNSQSTLPPSQAQTLLQKALFQQFGSQFINNQLKKNPNLEPTGCTANTPPVDQVYGDLGYPTFTKTASTHDNGVKPRQPAKPPEKPATKKKEEYTADQMDDIIS